MGLVVDVQGGQWFARLDGVTLLHVQDDAHGRVDAVAFGATAGTQPHSGGADGLGRDRADKAV